MDLIGVLMELRSARELTGPPSRYKKGSYIVYPLILRLDLNSTYFHLKNISQKYIRNILVSFFEETCCVNS